MGLIPNSDFVMRKVTWSFILLCLRVVVLIGVELGDQLSNVLGRPQLAGDSART